MTGEGVSDRSLSPTSCYECWHLTKDGDEHQENSSGSTHVDDSDLSRKIGGWLAVLACDDACRVCGFGRSR